MNKHHKLLTRPSEVKSVLHAASWQVLVCHLSDNKDHGMRFAFTGRSGLDSGLAIVFADHSRESHLSLPKAEDPRQLVMTGQAMARSGFTFRSCLVGLLGCPFL